MYEKHFRLDERPFSIAPDPRFLFMSARHREALAHLLYGVGEGGGFVQLTGEVGTGKTTLCRALLEHLPEHVDVAMILNPMVTAPELIATLCDELHVSYPHGTQSIKALVDALNGHLLRAHADGRRTVLLIDEAQDLRPEVLEQVRLLTNLETAREKLLQIILIGQPELRTLLARDDLRQLAQRVTARYHLEPMNRDETEAYIEHRLQVCGATGHLFSRGALDTVHRLTGGVPRLINILCDRALLGGYVEGRNRVHAGVVRRAAREVLPAQLAVGRTPRWPWAVAASLLLVGAAGLLSWRDWNPVSLPVQAQARLENAPSPAPSTDTAAPVVPGAAAAPGVEPPAREVEPVVPVPATPDPGVEDIEDRVMALFEAAERAGEDGAWYGLLARWGVQAQGGSGAQLCEQLPAHGLHCLARSGSWQALSSFDHPALLYLRGPDARTAVVFLQSIEDDQAELVAGDDIFHLPVAEVQRHWFGDYALVWQALPGGVTLLRAGDRGEAVRWVRAQLGVPALTVDDYFDDGLQAAVMEFQRTHRLDPDGVVGPRTIIQLNSAARQAGLPRLRSGAG